MKKIKTFNFAKPSPISKVAPIRDKTIIFLIMTREERGSLFRERERERERVWCVCAVDRREREGFSRKKRGKNYLFVTQHRLFCFFE